MVVEGVLALVIAAAPLLSMLLGQQEWATTRVEHLPKQDTLPSPRRHFPQDVVVKVSSERALSREPHNNRFLRRL